MKALLLPFLLFATTIQAQAQSAPQPQKGATTIEIATADSAKVAYAKVVAGLLSQGYSIDRNDKEALFFSTASRAVDSSVFIKIQALVTPTPQGSKAVFRSVFTWLSATTIMAHLENRELPSQFAGGQNGPSKRAWIATQQAALKALPAGTVTYSLP